MRYCLSNSSVGEQPPADPAPKPRPVRRSPRVVCAVPLTVSQSMSIFHARTAVISLHGALVVSPEPISEGTLLTLVNQKTGARAKATVVWTGLTPLSTPSTPEDATLPSPEYKIGVEFRGPAPEFWGSDYVV